MMSAESNSEKSLSYQKKDGRGHACQSFFWYDNDKDLKAYFLVTHHMSSQKLFTGTVYLHGSHTYQKQTCFPHAQPQSDGIVGRVECQS